MPLANIKGFVRVNKKITLLKLRDIKGLSVILAVEVIWNNRIRTAEMYAKKKQEKLGSSFITADGTAACRRERCVTAEIRLDMCVVALLRRADVIRKDCNPADHV